MLQSLSQYSSSISDVGSLVGFTPAQLNTWSMWPCCEMIFETKLLHSVVEPMSKASLMIACLTVDWRSEAVCER